MANYLVTGASGGMGSAIIRRLVREGHSVWGIDRTAPQQVLGWHFIAADLTLTEDIEAAFDTVRSETRYLNGIIHAAGIYDLDSLVEMPEENFLHDFDVNLFGMFRINGYRLPHGARKRLECALDDMMAVLTRKLPEMHGSA